MKFSQNDDVILILNLTDRRGKTIRVDMVNDIKIRIWTQDPNKFIGKTKRDIVRKPEYDMIVLSDYEMSSLPSGVIQYEYRYNTFSKDFNEWDGKYDRSHHIITDLYWKNKNISEHPCNPINYESLEALKDMIDREHNERIKQFKDLQHYVSEVYTNALGDEVERAQEAETALSERIDKSNEKVDKIETKLNEEIERANSTDIALFKYIKEIEEKSGGNKEEQDQKNEEIEDKIDTTKEDLTKLVEAEKERAEKVENELDAKIDKFVTKGKNKVSELNTLIEAEVTRSKGEEARIESLVYNFADNAKDQIKKVKKEVEKISDSTDGLSAKLDAEISDRKINDNETIANLNAEIKRATTNEDRLEEMIKNNSNLIQNENSRAELVEKDLAESLQKIKQSVLDNNSNVNSTLEELRKELNAEVFRATEEEENLQNQIDLLNSDSSVVGSVDHKIADSFHSVEHLLDEFKDSLEAVISGDYATKEELRQEILKLLGTAPEAYNTLGKIAEKLNSDDEVFAVIKEILTGKADADNVYTKAEIDRKEADLSNLIENETQRSVLAENGLQGQLDTLNGDYADFKEKVNKHIADGDSNYNELSNQLQQEINRAKAEEEAINNSLSNLNDDYASFKEKVNTHISDADNKYQELNQSIIAEQTRATNEETKLQNAIDVINGNEEVIGSIAHAIKDCQHYTDDAIEKVMHNVNDINSNLESHVEDFNNYKSSQEEFINSLLERIIKLETLVDWSDFS